MRVTRSWPRASAAMVLAAMVLAAMVLAAMVLAAQRRESAWQRGRHGHNGEMENRRRHNRIELQSQVAVTHFDVVHELRVGNASRSGLFLEGEVLELPEFSVGAEVTVRLFDEQLDEGADVLAMAKVVRVVRGKGPVASGIALEFTELGEEDLDRLERLLTRYCEGRGRA